jgi:hypothetical protein
MASRGEVTAIAGKGRGANASTPAIGEIHLKAKPLTRSFKDWQSLTVHAAGDHSTVTEEMAGTMRCISVLTSELRVVSSQTAA